MVMVEGLIRYARKTKNSYGRSFVDDIRATLNGTEPRYLDEEDMSEGPASEKVEKELIRMSVMERCQIVRVEGIGEAIEWLRNLTMDISNRPYK
jgi:hypothetical protein